MAGKVEERREIDLEELLGDRPRALVVEPPPRAVGENAPAEVAGGYIVDPPQVAQHLGRWRRLLAVPPGAAVERALPALGLHHCKAELVAPPFLGEAVGLALRRFVREQQAVRHVHPAVCAQVLLSQARRPPKPCEDGPDQIILGLAFVGRYGGREAVADRAQRGLEVFKRRVVQFLPVGRSGDGVAQEIAGEEAPLECGVDVHASADKAFSVNPGRTAPTTPRGPFASKGPATRRRPTCRTTLASVPGCDRYALRWYPRRYT